MNPTNLGVAEIRLRRAALQSGVARDGQQRAERVHVQRHGHLGELLLVQRWQLVVLDHRVGRDDLGRSLPGEAPIPRIQYGGQRQYTSLRTPNPGQRLAVFRADVVDDVSFYAADGVYLGFVAAVVFQRLRVHLKSGTDISYEGEAESNVSKERSKP